MALEKVAEYRCFWGLQQRFKHRSEVLNCDMHFSIYLPPQVAERNVDGSRLPDRQKVQVWDPRHRIGCHEVQAALLPEAWWPKYRCGSSFSRHGPSLLQ